MILICGCGNKAVRYVRNVPYCNECEEHNNKYRLSLSNKEVRKGKQNKKFKETRSN